MSAQSVQMIQGLYDAFATGDVPTVLGALSPDIAWTAAAGFPYGGTYHGQDAVLSGVFMRLATEWEGYAAVPSEIIDGGDTIVALGQYSGKYNATGKSFVAGFAHTWKIKDGKAVTFTQYTDTKLVAAALQP